MSRKVPIITEEFSVGENLYHKDDVRKAWNIILQSVVLTAVLTAVFYFLPL